MISMLAGATLTLVFAAEALEAVPDDRSDALSEVAQEVRTSRSRLDRMERVIERELAATRRDVHLAIDGRASGGHRGTATADPAGEDAATPAPSPHVSRDDAEPVSSKDLSALEPLADWKVDSAARQRWLFSSEQASLDAFGAPDEVSARSGSEWWTYWVTEGDHITREYRLQFNNGRLVDASLVTWKKPRAMPMARR
jgi:hypothetical protein